MSVKTLTIFQNRLKDCLDAINTHHNGWQGGESGGFMDFNTALKHPEFEIRIIMTVRCETHEATFDAGIVHDDGLKETLRGGLYKEIGFKLEEGSTQKAVALFNKHVLEDDDLVNSAKALMNKLDQIADKLSTATVSA